MYGTCSLGLPQKLAMASEGDLYTGWHTMAKAVREHDELKVKDVKEDIDTLLVFVCGHSPDSFRSSCSSCRRVSFPPF
jgi:hypothetical protein